MFFRASLFGDHGRTGNRAPFLFIMLSSAPMRFPTQSRCSPIRVALLLMLVAHGASAQSTSSAADSGDFVTVNGARLFYKIVGQGEPLLIIPGGPGDPHNGLATAFAPMAGHARLIFFDAFGRGRSDRAKSPTEYSLSRDIEDVEGLRVALKLGPLNVLGHSYGGIVAQGYALKYPKSVRRLILSSTFHSAEMWQQGNNDTTNFEIRNQYPEIWEKLQELRRSGRLSSDPEYQKIQGGVAPSLLYYYDPSNRPARNPGVPPQAMDVYFQIAGVDADVLLGGDMAKFDFRNRLASITVPTLITAGRFDRVAIPRFTIRFAEYAPQATFVMFERSGHAPFREEPDAYFERLRAFLARN